MLYQSMCFDFRKLHEDTYHHHFEKNDREKI